MVSMSDIYISTANQYECLTAKRNNSEAWQAYKDAAQKLMDLIGDNYSSCKFPLMPLLDFPLKRASEMKFCRLQSKREGVSYNLGGKIRRQVVYISEEPENYFTLTTYPKAIGAPNEWEKQWLEEFNARTVRSNNIFKFQFHNGSTWMTPCNFKLIGEGNARIVVFNEEDTQSIEKQLAHTYVLYQAMEQDEVCKQYHYAKNRLKWISEEFFIAHKSTIHVLSAPNATRKIEKWIREFQKKNLNRNK